MVLWEWPVVRLRLFFAGRRHSSADGRLAPDESFLRFLERCCPQAKSDPEQREAKQHALSYVTGFNAADPGKVGVHWLVKGMRADEEIEGDRAFRSQNGYQDLIDIFHQRLVQARVSIETQTVVHSVEWQPGRVEVIAGREEESRHFVTQRVLVTVPLAVLQAAAGETGALQFTPALPRIKLRALDKLVMGAVIRITLRFRHRFWDKITAPGEQRETLSNMSFLFSQDKWFPTWWTTMPKKLPMITGWAPAQCAEKLSGNDRSFVIERSLQTLGSLLGVEPQELEGWLDAAYFHDWQNDPFSRGAYSYGAVGADSAQEDLGSPVENTLFFAGEATDVTGHNGTVHGAIASGHRAAQEILRGYP